MLKSLIEIAKSLLEAMTWGLTYPGSRLLQPGQFSALDCKPD
jgi:hypothetical protein